MARQSWRGSLYGGDLWLGEMDCVSTGDGGLFREEGPWWAVIQGLVNIWGPGAPADCAGALLGEVLV